MDILKGHKSKIFAAVFIAIIGVGFGVIPYFSVAAIINNLVAKNANLNNYYPVSYTHLTLPTKPMMCRSRWSPCD